MRTSRSLRFEDEEEDPVEEDEFRSAADKRASIEKAREDHQRRRQELERQGPDSQGGRKKRRTSCTIGSPGKKSKRGPRVSPENKRTVRGAGGVEKPVRTRPRMTKEIVERLQRARGTGQGVAHRMLLLDTKQIAPVGAPDGACQEFTVLGATGNVHMCRVGRYHSCSCEDNESNRHKFPCKHILFCYVRFLIPMSDEEEKGLYDLRSQAILDSDSATGDGTQGDSMPCNSDGGGDGSEGDEAEEEKEDEEENGPKKPSGSGMDRLTQKFFPIWQRVLTISEANAVLRGLSDGRGVIDQSALANARLRRRYAQLKGTPLEFCPPEGPATGVGEVKQRPVEGDCPICAFEMSSAEEVVWCAVCGHNCHKVCMEAWAAAKRGRHGQAQCIFCRSLWQPGCDAEPSPDQANTAGHNNTSIGPHNLDPHREQPSIHELYPNVPRYVLDHIVQHRNPA